MATMTRLSRSASNVKSRMRDLRWPLITAASVVTLAGAGVLSVSGNAFAAPRFGTPCAAVLPAAERKAQSEYVLAMMGDADSGLMGAMPTAPDAKDDH